jgi:hypothetical protein
MRAILLSLFLAAFSLIAGAQPKQGKLVISNINPYYRLSPDGKTLCVYETDDNRDKWAIFLNLDDYTWQPTASISLLHSRVVLSSDLNSVYGNSVNYDGFKGDANWIGFKKYMSWYYPDSRDISKKVQWADKYFILAKRADGNLLAATGLHFKKVKALAYPKMTADALCVVNPATGAVVETLRKFSKDEKLNVPDAWITPSSFFLDNGNLLLSQNSGRFYYSLKPADGALRSFEVPVYISAFAGKYGMGQESVGRNAANERMVRKVIVDMETGQAVYDQKVSVKDAYGYWIAGWDKYFYTLNGHTSTLCKEEWNGRELVVLDSIKLDIKGVLANDSWGSRDGNNYRLVVAGPAGKVLMLPNTWSEFITPEKLIAWTLNDGRLSLVNPEFIQPSAAYMAKLNRPKLMTVPLNTLIKNHNGYYVLLSQNQLTKKYSAIKFVKDRKGNYERINKEEDAWDFAPVGVQVVSSTPCNRCNNTGMMNTVNRVTSEQTAKMIYNQVTTTTTRDVAGKATCSDCKGLGFAGNF